MTNRKPIKKFHGFAMLNIILGTVLLAGIIYLIMHTMTNFNSQEKARAVGEQLAPIIAELITLSPISTGTDFPLLSDADTDCNESSALLKNKFPAGYIQSLKASGFDLCANATVTIS